MRLVIIFDSKIDPLNTSLKEVIDSLLKRSPSTSKALKKAFEESLGVDLEDAEIYEDNFFVFLRENGQDRLFTKEKN